MKEKVKKLEMEREIFGGCFYFQPGGLSVTYKVIQQMESDFSVAGLCEALR